MAGKLSNSFELVKASAGVLQADKELLVFPALAGVSSILAIATFVVPAWWLGLLELMTDQQWLGYVFMFGLYLVLYSVGFFFNAALVGAALIRLDGGNPTLADGLNIAISKLPHIIGYAAISATVGMILRTLSERLGVLSQIVVGLIGMAWNLATFLVVPVLVTRDVGPTDAIKESATLFKKTWGEQVVGNMGIGLAFFVMFTSFAVVSAGLFFLVGTFVPVAILPLVVVVVAGFLFLMLAASAMSGIYASALYRFATTGETSGPFDAQLLSRAFRPKG